MIRRPPRSTRVRSSAASDVYKRQAYTEYSENGYHVTSAPIGAFALRYDFVDWGSSRPFFDIGAILSPFEKVRYSRSYTTSLGAVALDSSTNSSDYGVYGLS